MKRYRILMLPLLALPLVWLGTRPEPDYYYVPVVDYRKASPAIIGKAKIKKTSGDVTIPGDNTWANYDAMSGRFLEVGYAR